MPACCHANITTCSVHYRSDAALSVTQWHVFINTRKIPLHVYIWYIYRSEIYYDKFYLFKLNVCDRKIGSNI